MKQIETTILGQSYMLACPPDGEDLLREAVAIVDREMSMIRDAGKVKARERIAVLTALNLAYQRAEQSHLPAATSTADSAPYSGVASPTSSPSSNPSSGTSAAEAIDIEHLIQLIDTALGDDGQLL